MTKFVGQTGWAKGINNKANWRDMPDGFVRDTVNLDPLESGSMALRPGFDARYAGSAVRGALAVGSHVLVADGTALLVHDALANSTTTLATIAGAGLFAGAVLNEELFFCTENETLRYKAGVLRPWGVPTVTAQPVPSITSGALLPGVYQLAMTLVDAYGDEGATTQAVNIAVGVGQALSVTLPHRAGYTPRLYVSAVNGSTLYLQSEGAGTYKVNAVDDSTSRLETMHHSAPTPGSAVVSHNGVIATADGTAVWVTNPMRPHLVDRATRFFQFPAPVNMVASAGGGLYIGADKVYFIAGVETAEPEQTTVSEYPAVAGTAATLPDGRAVWMTAYGIAVSAPRGTAELVSDANFVPELALSGGSGIVQNNGNQTVVTTMRGGKGPNPMAASDYYEAEIITT